MREAFRALARREEAEKIDGGFFARRIAACEEEVIGALGLKCIRRSDTVGKDGQVHRAEFEAGREFSLHLAGEPRGGDRHRGASVDEGKLRGGVGHAFPSFDKMLGGKLLQNIGGADEARIGARALGEAVVITPAIGPDEVVVRGAQKRVAVAHEDAGERERGDVGALHFFAEGEEFVPCARGVPAVFTETFFVVENGPHRVGKGEPVDFSVGVPAVEDAREKCVAPAGVAFPVGSVEVGREVEDAAGFDQVRVKQDGVGGVGVVAGHDTDADLVVDARVAANADADIGAEFFEFAGGFLVECGAVAGDEDGDVEFERRGVGAREARREAEKENECERTPEHRDRCARVRAGAPTLFPWQGPPTSFRGGRPAIVR